MGEAQDDRRDRRGSLGQHLINRESPKNMDERIKVNGTTLRARVEGKAGAPWYGGCPYPCGCPWNRGHLSLA
jgi:hypothetical protein